MSWSPVPGSVCTGKVRGHTASGFQLYAQIFPSLRFPKLWLSVRALSSFHSKKVASLDPLE